MRLIGILLQPVAEAEAYLNGEGMHLDEVKQASLERIGVTETPILLLLNRNGIVVDTWVGKLASDKQTEALQAILRASAH